MYIPAMQDSTSSRSGGQRPRTRTLATLSDGMLCPQSPRFDMMQLTQSVCMKNTPVGCPCRFGRELPGAAVRAPCSRTGSSFGRRGGCPQPATPSWPTAGSRARRRALRRRCSRSPATCRSHPERLQSTGHTHKNCLRCPATRTLQAPGGRALVCAASHKPAASAGSWRQCTFLSGNRAPACDPPVRPEALPAALGTLPADPLRTGCCWRARCRCVRAPGQQEAAQRAQLRRPAARGGPRRRRVAQRGRRARALLAADAPQHLAQCAGHGCFVGTAALPGCRSNRHASLPPRGCQRRPRLQGHTHHRPRPSRQQAAPGACATNLDIQWPSAL